MVLLFYGFYTVVLRSLLSFSFKTRIPGVPLPGSKISLGSTLLGEGGGMSGEPSEEVR